jgi:serine/threonine protein kinase
MGTIMYMSPEQYHRSRDVTARSDVFSMGATLYELVMKRAPFAAGSEYDIRKMILEEGYEALPASTAPQIASAIRRALKPNPEDRFASCAELRDAIAQVEPRRPEVAQPAVLHSPPAERRSSGVGIAVALAVLVAGLLAMRALLSSPDEAATAPAPPAPAVATAPSASSSRAITAASTPTSTGTAVEPRPTVDRKQQDRRRSARPSPSAERPAIEADVTVERAPRPSASTSRCVAWCTREYGRAAGPARVKECIENDACPP